MSERTWDTIGSIIFTVCMLLFATEMINKQRASNNKLCMPDCATQTVQAALKGTDRIYWNVKNFITGKVPRD